jgi:hypothetical protein
MGDLLSSMEEALQEMLAAELAEEVDHEHEAGPTPADAALLPGGEARADGSAGGGGLLSAARRCGAVAAGPADAADTAWPPGRLSPDAARGGGGGAALTPRSPGGGPGLELRRSRCGRLGGPGTESCLQHVLLPDSGWWVGRRLEGGWMQLPASHPFCSWHGTGTVITTWAPMSLPSA